MQIRPPGVERYNLFLSPTLPFSFSEQGVLSEKSLPLELLPQLESAPPSLSELSPAIGLMYAVLQDAIDCFQRQSGRNTRSARRAQRLAREAEEWFFSDDLDWPFSFLNVCAALKLDPAYIRFGLQRWRQDPHNERRRTKRLVVPIRKALGVAA